VGAQQIARELPSIRIRVSRNSIIIRPGYLPEPVLSVTIGNEGRRPVTIEGVSFIAEDTFIGTPSIWVEQAPFTLADGDARTLYHPENGAIPADAAFLARDVLGRWWPRRRRLRLRIRRWRMSRPL
jgi:hypothetical protein